MARLYVDRINSDGNLVNWFNEDITDGHEVKIVTDAVGDTHVLVGAPDAEEPSTEQLEHFEAPDLSASNFTDEEREAMSEAAAAEGEEAPEVPAETTEETRAEEAPAETPAEEAPAGGTLGG